ncbi:MAG: hypothetical protein IPJ65_05240 [Archangiaceae bacterium]|nr:hypothetical protein [Archangiaceae bacterium]
MAFEKLDFEAWFGAPFALSGRELLESLALGNALSQPLRDALLAEELQRRDAELPEVSEGEVQQFVDRLRVALDYTSEAEGEAFLTAFDLTLEELTLQVWSHLRLEKYLAQRARVALEGDAGARAAVLWQSFFDRSLRPQALRAMSTRALELSVAAAPGEGARQRARSHLLALHGADSWPELKAKLHTLGISPAALDAAVERLAAALESRPS